MSDPFTSPSLWDRLELHGPQGRVTVPGVSKVNVEVGINEDSVNIPNKNGATTTLLGYKPAEISVAVQIWERAQFEQLKNLLQIYRPSGANEASAVDAVHPQLELFGVRQVYIVSISAPSYDPVGGYQLTLQLREVRPDAKGKGKPITKITGSKAGGAGATGGKPATAAQAGNSSGEGSDWGQPTRPVKPSTVQQLPRKP